ncbi:MAG TPA: DUF971 domain-containing protein [Oleiagrimonas sp.]|nr:DUF971 domain-containing protein [Oleiagrimonas sp.]
MNTVASVHPTDITLHRASRVLEVAFDNGEHYRLPCEYLRVHSPSAEVQGHHPSQRMLVPGKREVNIRAIEPMGHYAVLLHFDDGHASGIFSWETLLDLGRQLDEKWQKYVDDLETAGLSRDP